MAHGKLAPLQGAAIYPSLHGKRVIISGGGSGIGAGIVEGFVRQGARVAFVDVQTEPSEALMQELQGAAYEPLFLHCDITDCDDYAAKLATFVDELGGCDVLINNAANDDRHKLADVTPAYWDERMAVNLKHQFFAAKAVVPSMQELGRQNIRVNTIIPGNVQTPRQMKWYTPEGEAEIVAAQCLDGRIQPVDIAAMAMFLASDDARFCTAHNYWVDAGWR